MVNRRIPLNERWRESRDVRYEKFVFDVDRQNTGRLVNR